MNNQYTANQEVNRCLQGQGIGQGPCKPSQAVIPTELDQLDSAIKDLEEQFSALEIKLTPVVRSEPQPSMQDEKEPCGVSTPISDRLRCARRSLENLRRSMAQLTALVEL